MNFYHHLPAWINPVFFSVGPVSVHWYSLMWILAFVSVYFLLLWRITKSEYDMTKEHLQDVIFYSLTGAIVGGRLGYVFFYDLGYYVSNPLAIISPYNFEVGVWTGIFGLSFHGGALGVLAALWWYAHSRKESLLHVADFVIPAVPLGYFFGRLGNFFNGELYGRATDAVVGMNFGDGVSRHPSQLYEACGEGIVLFVLLWHLRNKKYPTGTLLALFMMGYATVRFFVEFYREPDAHLGILMGMFSMGQLLSGIMFLCGAGLMIWVWKVQKS